MKKIATAIICAVSLCASAQEANESKHLSNIRQLSYGGDNAEAYFSFDDRYLSVQVTNPKWGLQCDQIFDVEIARAERDTAYRPSMASTGKGRTTCSFFLPDGKHILYASTHLGADTCPPKPAPRADHKYLWPIYSDFDIFVADRWGHITKQLTNTKGYDAEATISPDGKKIVFTSMRSGDLEIYTMNLDGSDVKQITNELGYDGGAFFSPDSKKLVFRASRPKTPEDIKEYKDFLAQGLVAPTNMEIYTCNADGSDLRQVTHLGKANWAPYFTPSGNKIIFSSNHASQRGYDFHLYTVNLDGSGLEKITTESYFNAFPMFSHDGKKLVWSSNRDNHGTHDTNLFIADWKE